MTMTISPFDPLDTDAIVQLVDDTFTASEGAEEGALVSKLTRELAALAAGEDVFGLVARHDTRIVGVVFFSRFKVARGSDLFMLAPLAVHPDAQRQGVGKALIQSGLDTLRDRGVEACVSYGDPDYYGASGFVHITPEIIPPPYPLSLPHGWIAAPLQGENVATVIGPTGCVEPFDGPGLW